MLSSYAMQFIPSEQQEATWHLFRVKGLLKGVGSNVADFLLCKVDCGFEHVQFKVGDDMMAAQCALLIGDWFYLLIGVHGFSELLIWQLELMVKDSDLVDFVAGGVHTEAA